MPRQRVARRGGVALVEHEIDHVQHRCRAARAARRATAPGRECARRGSCPWRARCAGRPSAGVVRNARAISSVVRPQTSRSVSATCASGASAGWQQVKIEAQPVVLDALVVVRAGGVRSAWRRAARPRPSSDASNRARRRMPIDRLEAAGRDEPGARIGRERRPAAIARGRGEGIVQRLLGEIEIAEQADERGEDAARVGRGRSRRPLAHVRVVSHDMIDPGPPRTLPRRWNSRDRPHLDAPDARRGNPRGDLDRVVEVLAPRSGSSRRAAPCVSANGPSVVDTLPFRTRTVVAVGSGWSALPPR